MHIRALLNLIIWVSLVYAGVYGLSKFYGDKQYAKARGDRRPASKAPITAAPVATR